MCVDQGPSVLKESLRQRQPSKQSRVEAPALGHRMETGGPPPSREAVCHLAAPVTRETGTNPAGAFPSGSCHCSLALLLGQPAVLTCKEDGAQGRAAPAGCQLTHQYPSCQPQGPR